MEASSSSSSSSSESLGWGTRRSEKLGHAEGKRRGSEGGRKRDARKGGARVYIDSGQGQGASGGEWSESGATES